VPELLDIRTLFLNCLILSSLASIGTLLFARVHRGFHGIHAIGFGFLLIFTTFTLYSLRSVLGEFFYIVIPNTLLVMATAAIHIGLMRFHGQQSELVKVFHILMLLVAFYTSLRYAYVAPSTNMRIIIISGISAVQLVFCSAYLMHYSVSQKSTAVRYLGFYYLLFAAFLMWRIDITLDESQLVDFVDAGFIHGLTVVLYQLFILFTCFVVAWMASYKLQNDLSNQTRIDPLTQLYNRQALQDIVEQELSRVRRTPCKLGLICTEIDDYSALKQGLGRLDVERVVQQVAQTLARETRLHDSVARYSESGFVLVLPDTDELAVRLIAEKLRTLVEGMRIETRGGEIGCTLSLGFVLSEDAEQDGADLVEQAKQAMQQASSQGCNRIVMA